MRRVLSRNVLAFPQKTTRTSSHNGITFLKFSKFWKMEERCSVFRSYSGFGHILRIRASSWTRVHDWRRMRWFSPVVPPQPSRQPHFLIGSVILAKLTVRVDNQVLKWTCFSLYMSGFSSSKVRQYVENSCAGLPAYHGGASTICNYRSRTKRQ